MAIFSTLKRKVQTGATRIRSYLQRKLAKPHKAPKATAAERATATPACSDGQDDLSICSDSSSLWNVSQLSFRNVFDLSLESDQDAWTVDTMALDAILRDINGEEEDPDCPPRLRFRRCSSPELELKRRPLATAPEASSVTETEESPSVDIPTHAASPPAGKIILVQEANEDSRVDLTEAKASIPPVRPKHTRTQSYPLWLAQLPTIVKSRSLLRSAWSADSELVPVR